MENSPICAFANTAVVCARPPTGEYTGKRVEEEVLGKAYDSRLMRRLVGYMRPYWKLVALSLVFLLVQSGLQVLGPLLTKIAVDKYVSPGAAPARTFLDSVLP